MWCRWSEQLHLAAVLRKKSFTGAFGSFILGNILFFTHIKTFFLWTRRTRDIFWIALLESTDHTRWTLYRTYPWHPLAMTVPRSVVDDILFGRDLDGSGTERERCRCSRSMGVLQCFDVFRRCSVTENKEQFAKRTLMNPTSCHLHLSTSMNPLF